MTGQSLAVRQNLFIRARGYYATGYANGSGSIMESAANAYLLIPFSDDPSTPGATLIRGVHISEIRERVDALRVRYGLAPFSWTDPSLTLGVTSVRAQHILNMRAALAEVHTAAGRSVPIYSDPGLNAGTTVRAVHIMEIRAAIVAIE